MDELNIATQIKNITLETALKDLSKLQEMDITTITPQCRTGNNFIDFFMFRYRLQTISRKKMTFFQFVSNTEYQAKPYIQKLIKYQDHLKINKLTKLYRIFTLHCGTISLFKPIRAIEVYTRFKPRSILDPCSGWGGRLVGACVCNIPFYTGIDLNINLKEPYEAMINKLKPTTTTAMNIHFCDAVTFDYSNLKYDMVLTSPPYFNIELYPYTNKLTKPEWVTLFYIPLFKETFKYLELGGWFCINVNQEIYNDICVGLFGQAHIKLPMSNVKRLINNMTEFIYCWCKGCIIGEPININISII